ncbi:23102_t:CDS:1 [Cetraspora pellucida]|uniref:23102_t:CDS:1 n=1 Tax=Cetraspora pellucida TaxID=1433469 RepID=A0A9N9D001_9GLOM|nr:23102_t:CDS:1 [Cetraspora pellucida]
MAEDSSDSILSALTIPKIPNNGFDAHTFYYDFIKDVANFLLRNTRLHLPPKRTFTILEIEFYLRDEVNDHCDPFSHGHEHQLTCGEWYFHHVGRFGYRGGSRKGIDITFGSKNRNIYGGILIRAIRDDETNQVIEGPSLVVDKILELCDVDQQGGIRKLVEVKWKGQSGISTNMENSNGLVYLEKIDDENANNVDMSMIIGKKRRKNATVVTSPFFTQAFSKRIKKDYHEDSSMNRSTSELVLYSSPRVGLTLFNTQPSPSCRLRYLLKPYRFFLFPHLLNKGKMQIVIGLYERFKNIDKVSEASNISRSVVERCIKEMTAGMNNGNINDFVGKKGRGTNGNDYCRMVGAVRKWETETYNKSEREHI